MASVLIRFSLNKGGGSSASYHADPCVQNLISKRRIMTPIVTVVKINRGRNNNFYDVMCNGQLLKREYRKEVAKGLAARLNRKYGLAR